MPMSLQVSMSEAMIAQFLAPVGVIVTDVMSVPLSREPPAQVFSQKWSVGALRHAVRPGQFLKYQTD